jgi:hypothetical protein
MITIKPDNSFVQIRALNKIILINELDYTDFSKSLFVTKGMERFQIQPEELKLIDFMLLWYRHKPNYTEPNRRIIDYEFAYKNSKWVCK